MTGEKELVLLGRTRSGKRWFWAATVYGEDIVHGRCDDEETSLASARAEAERMLNGRPANTYVRTSFAVATLRAVNAERRKQRPGSGTTAERREYLYGVDSNRGEDHFGYLLPPVVVEFPITKKTARRIYYVRCVHLDGEAAIGYVDRQALERDGEILTSRSWDADSTVYAEPPKLNQPADPAAEVARLRREMTDAHPDRGGTSEAFIAARTRYEKAVNRSNRKGTDVQP